MLYAYKREVKNYDGDEKEAGYWGYISNKTGATLSMRAV